MPQKYYYYGQACKCLNTNYVIQYAVKKCICFILNENSIFEEYEEALLDYFDISYLFIIPVVRILNFLSGFGSGSGLLLI